jgi:3-methyladenine DNA glycosylase Tag
MNPLEQITPAKLGDYFDVMSKAVFQSGISWRVVEAKWTGTREVFRDFDPQLLIDLSPDDVDAMATDTRIIRNRRKVEAIIGNASRILDLERKRGSFQSYLRSKGGDFDALVKDLRKNFKFLGDMGAYYFLYVVGEQVPDHEAYMSARQRPRG